ncbi:sensor histidine kinase [Paenibacillus sp. LHD-117]|uniref:cache domain-containing sensor histidine kinase n=1 Tax=Paenibacillus sp. LHD-117 TaxID=3071412 RepID=UPI0027E0E4A9|nr:sensor histidine kinase [Paenibacillus sp. LHD-117]MDQ6420231.1 sensor histidine kinase [Paenibacillus sp. LHD-117]
MRNAFDRFKYNGLFIKMFIIMVVSIIAVSVTSTWTTINTSERVFMQTFSITNSKIIAQITSNMDAFSYAVVMAANSIQQSGSIRGFLTEGDGDSVARSKAYYNMSQQLKRIQSMVDAYEVSIVVTGVNGRSFSTDPTIWPISPEELRGHPITERTLKEPKKIHYQYDDTERSGVAKAEPTIIASKALADRATGRIYGAIYFSIREKEFKRFYESFTSLGNDVAVIDRAGTIVSANRTEWLGQPSLELLQYAERIEQQSLPSVNADIMDKDQIVLSKFLAPFGLYVVNLVDKEAAIGQLTDTRAIVLSVIVIVGVALIVVFLISRRMTKSLTRLVKQISTISKYEFDHHVAVDGSYETRQIGQAFNAMMDELQEYVKELVHTQKQQRNAELEALQQQINPHFLYNTLASVKFMVQQGSKEKAAATINALISLLQNAIGNVSETIPLSQELVNMKNYVFINHVRYGERIKMNYFVAPNCMGYHVPKLIIQPFIENAFFHGFNRKASGNIYFMAAMEPDALVCEVVDDGDGFDMSGREEGQLARPKGKRQLFTGIGVKNVHDRIKLLYGDGYGVTMTSEPSEGTKVKIRIPLLEEDVQKARF